MSPVQWLWLLLLGCCSPIDGFKLNGERLIPVASSPTRSSARFSPLLPKRCPSPPCVCDVNKWDQKVVTCAAPLTTIPVQKMDPETQIIRITASPGRYNSLTLGRIFDFDYLDELHITRSKLPAIGTSTFCPASCVMSVVCESPLRVLNLSQNNIVSLFQDNFNCLDRLQVLDLSDNNLSTHVPSAPFMRLKALRKLSLARNKIHRLAPLMFHSLTELEVLDLSENPLAAISLEDFRMMTKLETLRLNGCQLTRIDGYTFSELSRLYVLDLSENYLKHLNQTAFRGLENLDQLLLNSNSLTVLPDGVFAHLNLSLLDVSRNLINPLTNCAFCQATAIKRLDLSGNKLTSFAAPVFEPVAHTLQDLAIDQNHYLIDAVSSLLTLLQPLRRLERLSAAAIGLDESLPESTFDAFGALVYLNISRNNLTELNSRLLSPLIGLKVLDVSGNQLTFIDPSTFQAFRNARQLSAVYLHDNPFSCYRCKILPFIDWLNTDPQEYWQVCPQMVLPPTDDYPESVWSLAHCARCATPDSLRGRYLHQPDLIRDLQWCSNPAVQLRLTASEPQVGLILACLVIVSLVALILVVVTVYRKHGAGVYYTQEDKMIATKEEIYAASVVGQPLHWAAPAHGTTTRMISMASTANHTISRQNMFSPQSSVEQPTNNYGSTAAVAPESSVRGPDVCVGCTECAQSPAVKQVIASIPAMTEMLENSLQKLAAQQQQQQYQQLQQRQSCDETGVKFPDVTDSNNPKPPSIEIHDEDQDQDGGETATQAPIRDRQRLTGDGSDGDEKNVQIYI